MAYFAYHREDERIVVGFYFAAATGQATAAFEIRDEGAKKLFTDHFEAASAGAQPLLEYVPDQDSLRYNRDLYRSVRTALEGRLGESETSGLVGWELSPSRPAWEWRRDVYGDERPGIARPEVDRLFCRRLRTAVKATDEGGVGPAVQVPSAA